MAKTIFTMVSVTSHDETYVDADGKVKITDVIETTNDANDANEITVELTSVAEECSTALDVTAELTDQEHEQVDLIDNHPEQITEEVVQIAQENFAYSVGKLGYSKEELNNMRKDRAYQISLESDKSPVVKLRIATEGIKEFIEKIIQKVKDFLLKFVNLFKKFGLKLRKMLDSSKARAEVLLGKVDEKASYKVAGDSLEYVNSMFIGMQAVDGAAGGGKLEIEKGNQAVKGMISTLVAMSNALKSKAGGTWKDVVANNTSDLALAKDIMGFISPAITKIPFKLVGWVLGKFKVPEGTPPPLLIRFMNKQIKVVIFKVDTGINACEIQTLGAGEFPNLKEFTVNGQQIKKWLEIALENAKNTEQFHDQIEAVSRDAREAIAKIEKLPASKESKATGYYLNILGRLSTSITIEMVKNYLDFNNGICKLASMLISGSGGEKVKD